MNQIKIKKISLFIISFFFLLLISYNHVLASDIYGYKTGVSSYSRFSSLPLCQTDITNKNIGATMSCSKLDTVTVNLYCPEFAKVDQSLGQKVQDLNAITNQIEQDKTTYKLLAPLPGFSELKSSDSMGKYFNIMIEIAIGLCAVLAVIMLIIGGIQYMGNESIFGKTEARSQMTKAILGLLIAVGSYALLNTISPALLGVGGLKIKQVDAGIVPLYDRGANDPKQANGESIRCTPVTTAGSPCTVANLTKIFGAENAVAMSKICNMVSSGRVGTISSTDYCVPGKYPDTSFSYGLFQVNLSANGSLAAADCVGIFDRAVTSKDAIEPKYNSGFNCKILPGKENLFKKCRGLLLDTNTNLAIAKKLFTDSKSAWLGDKKYCASAFK